MPYIDVKSSIDSVSKIYARSLSDPTIAMYFPLSSLLNPAE